MKGDLIPNADHVARVFGASHIREDGGVSGSAFKPRPGEAFLSVNWLEYYLPLDRMGQLASVRSVLAQKRTVGAKAKIAVLNVGAACAAARAVKTDPLSMRHEPETSAPADPSHSGIYGYTEKENRVQEALAATISEVVGARVEP